jgi:hypothetical protein
MRVGIDQAGDDEATCSVKNLRIFVRNGTMRDNVQDSIVFNDNVVLFSERRCIGNYATAGNN